MLASSGGCPLTLESIRLACTYCIRRSSDSSKWANIKNSVYITCKYSFEPKCIRADRFWQSKILGFFFVICFGRTDPSPPNLSFWTDPLQILMQTLVTCSIVFSIAVHSYGTGPIPLQHQHDLYKQHVPKLWGKVTLDPTIRKHVLQTSFALQNCPYLYSLSSLLNRRLSVCVHAYQRFAWAQRNHMARAPHAPSWLQHCR